MKMNWKYEHFLKDKYIHEILVADDGSRIAFIVDDYLFSDSKELVLFETEADCCSETYLYEINSADVLRDKVEDSPRKILLVETKDTEIFSDNLDRTTTYCITFHTNAGRCDVIFRNEDNGYYGGSLRYLSMNNLDNYKKYYNVIYDIKNRIGFKEVVSDWKLDEKKASKGE